MSKKDNMIKMTNEELVVWFSEEMKKPLASFILLSPQVQDEKLRTYRKIITPEVRRIILNDLQEKDKMEKQATPEETSGEADVNQEPSSAQPEVGAK